MNGYYPGTPQNVPCRRFCAEKMSLMLANSPTARQAEGYLGTRTRYLGSNLIPTMPEHKLLPLLERFAAKLREQPVFTAMFGVI